MTDIIKFEFDALDELLEAERDALLKGNLSHLAEMAEDKEQLIIRLNETRHDDLEALRLLDSKVKRNQVLLDGALEGIRTVARKLAALRRIRATLDTYDASGQKRSIEVEATRSVERRA